VKPASPCGAAKRRHREAGVGEALEVATDASGLGSARKRAVEAVGGQGQRAHQWRRPVGRHWYQPDARERHRVGRAELAWAAVLGLDHAEVPVEHQGCGGPPAQPRAQAAPKRLDARPREKQPATPAQRHPPTGLRREFRSGAADLTRPPL